MEGRLKSVNYVRGQLITTFGVGCVVDLPQISAMVMGLDDWPVHATEELGEERLLASVRALLGGQVKSLRCPPRTRGNEPVR